MVQGGWGRAALAVVVRPWLWLTAVSQLFRLARRGWWRRPPFLPLPDRDYLRFRLETAYGDRGGVDGRFDARVDAHDVVTYLEWCRRFPS